MDSDATPGGIRLEVQEASPADVGLGRARVDAETRTALHVDSGEVLKLIGKKTTPAIVFRLKKGDEGKGITRIDDLVRRNLDVSIGEKIEVQKADILPAKHLTISPIITEGHKISFGQGIENFVKRGLLKRPLNKGDVVIVPGIALMGGALPFMVFDTVPEGIVQVQADTIMTLRDEAVWERASVGHPPPVFLERLEMVFLSLWDQLERAEGDVGARARLLRDEIRRLLEDAKRSADTVHEPDTR